METTIRFKWSVADNQPWRQLHKLTLRRAHLVACGADFIMSPRTIARALLAKSFWPASAQSESLAHAEHALMAEALLRATVGLLDRVDPMVVVEKICQQIVEALPHIPLLWAWVGDPHSPSVKPQVALGPACAVAGELIVPREFLTQNTDAPRFATGELIRLFEISPLSLHGPWRQAAMQYGARSILVATRSA